MQGHKLMKKSLLNLIFAFAILSLIGCSTTQKNTITHLSTIDAILAGAYDGYVTLGDLTTYGDFGIGTFDRLDGEMILLDGKVFQVKADGKVYTPASTVKTPYASVVQFKKDITTKLPKGIDYSTLKNILAGKASNMNVFCAVKVNGRFTKMKTRSVPAQRKPYPPLTEVTKDQVVFHLKNVSGTIVGFRSPAYVKGIGVPGYHLHFISDDFRSGGHILEFELEEGTAEIDICNRFLMILPEGVHDFSQIDLSIDRSEDVDKAEK